MHFAFILFLVLGFAGAAPKQSQRIVGGSAARIQDYPEIAALLFTFSASVFRQQCAGVILNNRSVLTAAHCTFGEEPEKWRIRVGSANANSGGTVFEVALIINHGDFSIRTKDSDISILRTRTNIFFNPTTTIRPASLASSNFNLGNNQQVWAAGWGAIRQGGTAHTNALSHVNLVSIDQVLCETNYRTIGMKITSNMLCAGVIRGGRDQCHGDGGGPLYRNGVVVGISSFGYGCGRANFPGVNARVSRFRNWIAANA